jgi:hypothetical protein
MVAVFYANLIKDQGLNPITRASRAGAEIAKKVHFWMEII